MGRKKLSTKGRKDKIRSAVRIRTIKQNSWQPVLKNITGPESLVDQKNKDTELKKEIGGQAHTKKHLSVNL